MAILAVPRGEDATNVQQRFTPAQVAAGKTQAWLHHLNAQRYDIYLGVNPVREDSRQREKGDIAQVRRLQVDLDKQRPGESQAPAGGREAGHRPPAPPLAPLQQGPLSSAMGHRARPVEPRPGRGHHARYCRPLRRRSGLFGSGPRHALAWLPQPEAGAAPARWSAGSTVAEGLSRPTISGPCLRLKCTRPGMRQSLPAEDAGQHKRDLTESVNRKGIGPGSRINSRPGPTPSSSARSSPGGGPIRQSRTPTPHSP